MISTIVGIASNKMVPPPTSTGNNQDGGVTNTPAETIEDTEDLPAVCCPVGAAPASVRINGFTSGCVVEASFSMRITLAVP